MPDETPQPPSSAGAPPSGASSSPSAPNYAVELPYPEELQEMLGGAYVIESFLGQGGMGAVYKGLQMPLRRPVAVKILSKAAGDDYGFQDRFKREAYAMAALTHPHIVHVYDCGDAGEHFLFISMELVEGGDLNDAIKNGQVTPEVALKLMPQICDGLHAAHEVGIVHRDIKPANIFLTADGRAKVADFGLAKKFSGAATMVTKTGLGLGTPDYAAPEQYENVPDIDHRADVYSLGVMFYQMLTGGVPRGAWKSPSSKAGTDPRLDAVVMKAMEYERDDRYQSVAELKADLLAVISPSFGATGAVPVARAPQPDAGQTSGTVTRTGVPARTGPVRSTGAPLRSGPVPVAQSPTGPVRTKQSGAVPTRSQAVPIGRPATRPANAPAKPLPVGLISALVVGLLAVGGGYWMLRGGKSAASGQTVELIDSSNPAGRPLRGLWTITGDGLNGKTPAGGPGIRDADRMPVYQFDYAPPEEYDLEVEFTRFGGSIVQVLSSGGVDFTHEFTTGSSDQQPTRAGIQMLDGKDINNSPEGTVMILPPSRDGTRHVAVVQVRRGSIRSTLDGKDVLNWKGDFSRLSMHPTFRLEDSGRLGVAIWNGEATYHRATVREISGPGQRIQSSSLAGTGGAGGGTAATSGFRSLVEWVVGQKGFVIVETAGINRKITKPEEMPASYGRVVEVDVPGNRAPGAMPADALRTLCSFTELTRVALRKCKLIDADWRIILSNNPKLTHVNLEGNDITDAVAADLAKLPEMVSVSFAYTKPITGVGFEKLKAASKLTNLTVNDSSVSDAGLASIGQVSQLKYVNLTSTRITDAGVPHLAGLRDLESLQIRWTAVTARGILALSGAPKLRRIEICLGRGINDIRDVTQFAGKFPSFKELQVDFGGGPTETANAPQLAHVGALAALTGLTRLELNGSGQAQASTMTSLSGFEALTNLNISARFTDDDIALLKGLRSLMYLNIFNGKLTEFGALNLVSAVPNLREINKTAFTEAGLKAFKQHFPAVRVF